MKIIKTPKCDGSLRVVILKNGKKVSLTEDEILELTNRMWHYAAEIQQRRANEKP